MATVLAIDDDRTVLNLIRRAFDNSEVEVFSAGDATEGISQIQQHKPDVVLLDLMLPGIDGMGAFRQIREVDAKLPVIFITAGGSSDTAIEAMKLGAQDYLLKPLDLVKVQALVRQAIEIRRLMSVPVRVPDGVQGDGDAMVGRSPHMQEVYKAIGRVAPQNVPVLIRGESGTGKELVARAVYHHSDRSDGPFMAVNCAAIPETLLESELFGHEKGSFTGADSRRIGKFEQCSGGTIFLDEVGDMTPLVQSKVLRLLQEQRFERVGGNVTIETDVRIISATNRDIEEMVEKNEFRSDLYYRLNGYSIDLPPLRDRHGDLAPMIDTFLARFSRELGKEMPTVSEDAMRLLEQYDWPGNVRELQSVLKQTLLHASGSVIIPEFLPDVIRGPAPSTPLPKGELPPSDDLEAFLESRIRGGSNNLYAETLELMEQVLLTRVLHKTGGNQSKASKILGITRGSLRNKIRSLGITIDHVVSSNGH